MPKIVTASSSRLFLATAVLLGTCMLNTAVWAQMNPQMPPQPVPQSAPPLNPICPRLEAQLAALDHGGSSDPATDEQIRRYEDAAAKQQAELDHITSRAKRMGCDSSGFFSLFTGRSAQCGPVNNQIQQMRANLDQITTSLERLRNGGLDGRDGQRRSVLTALAQNNCGPQYTNAAAGPGNFLSNLFGNNNPNQPPPPPGVDMEPQSGTYRTVCVRSCDGGYFPISFATVPGRFADDERTCKALCPATDASLFVYRNPGEDMNQAVSINGTPYTSLPNAFRYRTQYNSSCSCKAAGQTWAEALKSIDDKAAAAQQGDIIVTEESAKRMQQRQLAKPAPAAARNGATPPATTASTPAPSSTATAPADSSAAPNDKQIRVVGPPFLPQH